MSSNWNTSYDWGDHALAGYEQEAHCDEHDGDHLTCSGEELDVSDDWWNSCEDAYVCEWWNEDDDVDFDEISESKINFTTPCAAGNHYYLNGNDLACEADGGIYTADEVWIDLIMGEFNFNESMLETIYYNASSLKVVTGTGAGALVDIQTYNQITYNVTETSSDFELRVNFTGITSFTTLLIRHKTDEEDSHAAAIQIWDYDSSSWEGYGYLSEFTTSTIQTLGVYDDSEHISGGVVQVRIYQSEVGNSGHVHQFDWVGISKGYGTPVGTEVDPFWNSDKDNYYNKTEVLALNGSWDDDNTNCSVSGSCPAVLYNDEVVSMVGNWTNNKGDYWNTSTDLDTVISADEIAEANIKFTTACSSTQKYYLVGNDLAVTDDIVLTREQVEDYVDNLVINGDGIDITYYDGFDELYFKFDCSDIDGAGLSCSGEYLIHDDTSSFSPDSNGYLTNVTTDTYGHVQTETYTQVGYHKTHLSGDGNVTVVIIF